MEDPFVAAVDAWIDKAGKHAELALRMTALGALQMVQQLTPVNTGYLRASWTAIKGTGVTRLDGARADESVSVIQKLKLGDGLTLLNPVVYARRIEYGYVGVDRLGRHYDQKGYHMMAQTVAALPQIAAKAAQAAERSQ